MTLALQGFLRESGGDAIAELASKYAIKARPHAQFPNLVLFKYDQIHSPFAEQIVQESRGIVLDRADNWRVVSRSFDKFFNHGEAHAAEIDWSTARVQEKLDGSLCVLYWYAAEWRVQTSGTPDARGPVDVSGMTYADLFWSTWRSMGYELPCRAEQCLCFAFELTTPRNRVVVRYTEPRLTLIGVRCRDFGDQFKPSDWHPEYNPVAEHSLRSLDEILATFQRLDPVEHEGYVVVDGAFRRVKVKHPGYVALHHMKGEGLSVRRVLEVLQAGESAELLAHFPEWTPEFEDARQRLDGLCAEVEDDYERLRWIPVQKDFALQAVKTRCSAALFAVRAGKAASIREFLMRMRVENLATLLGLRAEPEEVAA